MTHGLSLSQTESRRLNRTAAASYAVSSTPKPEDNKNAWNCNSEWEDNWANLVYVLKTPLHALGQFGTNYVGFLR